MPQLQRTLARIRHFAITYGQMVQQRASRSKPIINFLAYTAAAKIHIIQKFQKSKEMLKQNKKEISAPVFWLPILLMLTVVVWMTSEFAETYSARMNGLKSLQNPKQEGTEQMKLTSHTAEPTEPSTPPAPQTRQDFFAQNWQACKDEEQASGVPALVKLAQMSIETNDGEGFLAKNANNYFGIKCFRKRCHAGHCINRTDDSHKDFFIKYKTKWESIRAHSDFLKNKNYKRCWDCTTPECWARELKSAGYATAPNYEQLMLDRINQIRTWQKIQ